MSNSKVVPETVPGEPKREVCVDTADPLVLRESVRRSGPTGQMSMVPDKIGIGLESKRKPALSSLSPGVLLILGKAKTRELQVMIGSTLPAFAVVLEDRSSEGIPTDARMEAIVNEQQAPVHGYIAQRLPASFARGATVYINTWNPAAILFEEDKQRIIRVGDQKTTKSKPWGASNTVIEYYGVKVLLLDPYTQERYPKTVEDMYHFLRTTQADVMVIENAATAISQEQLEEFEKDERVNDHYEKHHLTLPRDHKIMAKWESKSVKRAKIEHQALIWVKLSKAKFQKDLSAEMSSQQAAMISITINRTQLDYQYSAFEVTEKMIQRVKRVEDNDEDDLQFMLRLMKEVRLNGILAKREVPAYHPYYHFAAELKKRNVSLYNYLHEELDKALKDIAAEAKIDANLKLSRVLQSGEKLKKKELLPAHYKKPSTSAYQGFGFVLDNQFKPHFGLKGQAILASHMQEAAAATFSSHQEWEAEVKKRKKRKIHRSDEVVADQAIRLMMVAKPGKAEKAEGMEGIFLEAVITCCEHHEKWKQADDAEMEAFLNNNLCCNNIFYLVSTIISDEFLNMWEDGEWVAEPLFRVKPFSIVKDINKPFNHRPVVHCPHTMKLIGAAADEEMQPYKEKLPHFQCNNNRKEEHPLVARLRMLVHTDGYSVITKLDASNAFDSMLESLVKAILAEVCPQMADLAIFCMEKMMICVPDVPPEEPRTNAQVETIFNIFYLLRGIRQGWEPASDVFCIGFADCLASYPRPEELLQYVDDLTLLSKSIPSAKESVLDITKRLQKAGLKLNEDKCKTMMLKKPGESGDEDFKDFITIMGFELDQQASFQHGLLKILEHALDKVNSLILAEIDRATMAKHFVDTILPSFMGSVQVAFVECWKDDQTMLLLAVERLVRRAFRINDATVVSKALLIMLYDPMVEYTADLVTSASEADLERTESPEEIRERENGDSDKQGLGVIYTALGSGRKLRVISERVMKHFQYLQVYQSFKKEASEEAVKAAAEALVDMGLQDVEREHGFFYNIKFYVEESKLATHHLPYPRTKQKLLVKDKPTRSKWIDHIDERVRRTVAEPDRSQMQPWNVELEDLIGIAMKEGGVQENPLTKQLANQIVEALRPAFNPLSQANRSKEENLELLTKCVTKCILSVGLGDQSSQVVMDTFHVSQDDVRNCISKSSQLQETVPQPAEVKVESKQLIAEKEVQGGLMPTFSKGSSPGNSEKPAIKKVRLRRDETPNAAIFTSTSTPKAPTAERQVLDAALALLSAKSKEESKKFMMATANQAQPQRPYEGLCKGNQMRDLFKKRSIATLGKPAEDDDDSELPSWPDNGDKEEESSFFTPKSAVNVGAKSHSLFDVHQRLNKTGADAAGRSKDKNNVSMHSQQVRSEKEALGKRTPMPIAMPSPQLSSAQTPKKTEEPLSHEVGATKASLKNAPASTTATSNPIRQPSMLGEYDDGDLE